MGAAAAGGTSFLAPADRNLSDRAWAEPAWRSFAAGAGMLAAGVAAASGAGEATAAGFSTAAVAGLPPGCAGAAGARAAAIVSVVVPERGASSDRVPIAKTTTAAVARGAAQRRCQVRGRGAGFGCA
jgi:hypothetical protein